MVLSHDFSEELREKLKKLFRRDKRRYDILMKKIESIISCDEITIEHFKNLKGDLSFEKRVHIDKSFILTFHFDKSKKFILFLNFDHHDNAYK